MVAGAFPVWIHTYSKKSEQLIQFPATCQEGRSLLIPLWLHMVIGVCVVLYLFVICVSIWMQCPISDDCSLLLAPITRPNKIILLHSGKISKLNLSFNCHNEALVFLTQKSTSVLVHLPKCSSFLRG